ncbi:hypothetical protein PsYK624_124690 [Phanerochaete sordida]|uniref:Uncharacterized protein n=1 Tax=Phanerochaete sordida TaxID=48140 RepID=A0A9P3GJG3_9APHY|nr:hypothetical protein PsYK624_124690 [Phanerochaete sordida]
MPYPCPLSPPAQQHCTAITHHALALWPRYVSEAANSKVRDTMLTYQLDSFIPSRQLAMYAWVTTPRQVVHTGKALIRYLAPARAAICSHYFKFVYFVHLHRDPRSAAMVYTAPADRMQAIWEMCKDGGGADLVVTRPSEATVSLQLITAGVDSAPIVNISLGTYDVTRYRDIMRDFHAHLQDAFQEVINYEGLLPGTYRIGGED